MVHRNRIDVEGGYCSLEMQPVRAETSGKPARPKSQRSVLDMLISKEPLALVEQQSCPSSTDVHAGCLPPNVAKTSSTESTSEGVEDVKREPLASTASEAPVSSEPAPVTQRSSSSAENWLASGLNALYLKRAREQQSVAIEESSADKRTRT